MLQFHLSLHQISRRHKQLNMLAVNLILASAIVSQGLHAIQWTGTLGIDGVMYACKGDRVTFPWHYTLDAGDTITHVEWFYHGQSEEVIAALIHDQFITYPAFANRVQQVDNAGITLDHVIPGDSGNYSVFVEGSDQSGSHFEVRQFVVLQIHDQMMTSDGELHVTQNPLAVLDTTSGDWSIQLACGHFTFPGQPPFPVEWITPTSSVRASTDYSQGQFNLLLTNPVHGGTYTCRIPSQHIATACLHGNGSARGESSIMVNKVDARLTLLEKENQVQRQVNDQQRQVNDQQRQEIDQQRQEIDQQRQEIDQQRQVNDQQRQEIDQQRQVNDQQRQEIDQQRQEIDQQRQVNDQLQHENQQLREQVNKTDGRVDKLEDRASTQVSFQARFLADSRPASDTPLIVNDVLYNHGNAYDSNTGRFTAPWSGTYFFIATTGSESSGNYAYFYLMVDNSYISYGQTYNEGHHGSYSSVHGAVHLNARQTVWVSSYGDTYSSGYTTFSGFLVSLDMA